MKIIISIFLIASCSFSTASNTTSDNISSKRGQIKVNDGLAQVLSIASATASINFPHRLCIDYQNAQVGGSEEPLDVLKRLVLKELGIYKKGMDLDTEAVDKKVIKFLNENKDNLICGDFTSTSTYPMESFYKRAISNSSFELFNDFLTESDYPVDYNAIEIRNGKKETLLDFIDMRIKAASQSGMRELLRDLKFLLIEQGAKNARELP